MRGARERGVALLAALLLMLAILMTGVAAARSAAGNARIAHHERDRMLALHGAMAGLLDAEQDIEGGADPGSPRAMALGSADPAAFAEGCRGGASYQGLCAHVPGAEAIFLALADPDGPGVELGAHTGSRIPSGGALASTPPRYLIERMPSVAGALLYRITALGFGSAGTTQVAVQAYYRKLLLDEPPAPALPGTEEVPGVDAPVPGAPAPETDGEGDAGPGEGGATDPPPPSPPPPSPPAPDLPPGAPGSPGGPGIRVAWREIGNWQDTVAAAARREGQ